MAGLAKTVEEVAQATGVSVTTVRLVINGQAARYRISAATRERVGEYVARHGLSINQVARSLKLRRSEAIGLVIPEINNPFFAGLMAALEALCRADGLVLLTASTQERPDLVARALDTLVARGVDALIVAPSTPADRAAALAREVRFPLAFVDRLFDGPPWPSVASDHRRSSMELTAAMCAADPRPIAFLCANPDLPSIAARRDGFRQALGAAGAPAGLELHSPQDGVSSGRDLMARLLSQHPLGTCSVLCSSLPVLEGALKEIRAGGGTLTPDLLLGTFDDHPMLDFLPCPVISATQDIAAIASALFSLVRGAKGRQEAVPAPILVPGRIVLRRHCEQAGA